jgi:hypothetical protein
MKDNEDLEVTTAPAEAGGDEFPEKHVAIGEVDAALLFLEQGDSIPPLSPAEEKRMVRKIDALVMPLLFGTYLFQYMDKSLSTLVKFPSLTVCYTLGKPWELTWTLLVTVNYANVMGLSADTHMTPSQFSYLATFFFTTFFFFQPLHGWLTQRFPPAKYLGYNVIIWGIILTRKN